MAYKQINNPFKKNGVIKKGRKKHARSIREHGHYVEGQEPGTESTHLMESDIKGNPTGTYNVWPSITTDKENYYDQTPEQAYEAGKCISLRIKRKQKNLLMVLGKKVKTEERR